MPVVKYRSYSPSLHPRRTQLAVPGWGGVDEPRADGSHEQPWHCIPFTEAARHCLEIPFPHETETRVSCAGGLFSFDGSADDDERQAPFRSFGDRYYTYQLLLDVKVEPGLAIKIDVHPRFFTDLTGTVPVAVPAIVRHWWPMVNFVVFKAPLPGQVHVFRPGEPMLAISVVAPDDKLEVAAMDEEEAAERELMSRRMHAARDSLSIDSQWTSSTDTVFDGTYRRLYGAARSKKER